MQLVAMMSVPSGTVFVRRALSYLMIGQAELALRDAMQAQVCLPEWPTAFYMQALALSKLGMESDAQDMLNDGASFEAKKQSSWRIWISFVGGEHTNRIPYLPVICYDKDVNGSKFHTLWGLFW